MSSVIAPFNPGTRDVPATVEGQLANIFTHVGKMLAAAGATWDDVVKMNFWMADAAQRAALDAPWVEHFPNAASRPARHTHGGGGDVITADFTAYITAP